MMRFIATSNKEEDLLTHEVSDEALEARTRHATVNSSA
jgi:hypothetical protein